MAYYKTKWWRDLLSRWWYIIKPNGEAIWYQKDGKTIYFIKKPNGNYIYYDENGNPEK